MIMENTDIPIDFTGVVFLYMTPNGLRIDVGRITDSPIGSILNFIVQDGIIKAKFGEKYDESGLLIYSYYYS